MSKQQFSVKTAWEKLHEEENMLRGIKPFLKVAEPVVSILYVLLLIVIAPITDYALLIANCNADWTTVMRKLPLLWDLIQPLNYTDGYAAMAIYYSSILIPFGVCLIASLVLRLCLCDKRATKISSLPEDALSSIDCVRKKAEEIKALVRKKTHLMGIVSIACVAEIIVFIALVFASVDVSHHDFSAVLVGNLCFGVFHCVLSVMCFFILRKTVLRPENDRALMCYPIYIDAKEAYEKEKDRLEQELKAREREKKIKKATEQFYAKDYAQVRELLADVTDTKNGDIGGMKIVSDIAEEVMKDVRQAYKLLWDAKDLGFKDHKIGIVVDEFLDEITPRMLEDCEEEMSEIRGLFLQKMYGRVEVRCKSLAKFDHPDATILMVAARLLPNTGDMSRYPEWLELARKAKARGVSPELEGPTDGTINMLETGLRQYEMIKERQRNRSASTTKYTSIPEWAEPSGWTDFRTGETLYRVNGKIVNGKGEEVSVAWWE